jgi:hypothetical protein
VFPGVVQHECTFEGNDTHLNVEDGTHVDDGCIGFSCIEVGHWDGEGCRYPGFAGVGVELYHCASDLAEMGTFLLVVEANLWVSRIYVGIFHSA